MPAPGLTITPYRAFVVRDVLERWGEQHASLALNWFAHRLCQLPQEDDGLADQVLVGVCHTGLEGGYQVSHLKVQSRSQ